MKTEIRCQWANWGKVLVNPDGQVWPCCYFANRAYHAQMNGGFFTEENNWFGNEEGAEVLAKYNEHKEDLNIKNKSMEEILNHEWYTKDLPESWEKEETRFQQCRKFCEHYSSN